jgi:hypothetical protein
LAMRRMLLMATICLVAFTATAALADEASHKKAVLRLLEVNNMKDSMDMVGKSLVSVVVQQYEMAAANLPPDGRKAIYEARDECIKSLLQDLSWEKMRDYLVEVNVEVFTEEEVNGLIQFYESPLGQKILKKMPELIQTAMAKSQSGFQRKLPEFQNKLSKMVNDLKVKYKTGETLVEISFSKANGPAANGRNTPPTREAKWSTLVGTWFGIKDLGNNGKFLYISEKKGDGTYRNRFKIIDPSGKKEDKVETGEWGVSGEVYFTIYKEGYETGSYLQADATDPANRDAYKILKLDDDNFEYQSLDMGEKFTAKKVASDFAFPE